MKLVLDLHIAKRDIKDTDVINAIATILRQNLPQYVELEAIEPKA